jgi:hypothetical protein
MALHVSLSPSPTLAMKYSILLRFRSDANCAETSLGQLSLPWTFNSRNVYAHILYGYRDASSQRVAIVAARRPYQPVIDRSSEKNSLIVKYN